MLVSVIVFSYNRACQLDACLGSLKKHFLKPSDYKVSVLWKASADKFESAYKKVMEYHADTNFVKEQSFSEQTKMLLNSSSGSPLTMFLVDDDVFIDTVRESDRQFQMLKTNSQLAALSLRMHKDVTKCYPLGDKPVKVPPFVKGCVWNWMGCEGDWGYPMSLDGNVYNTKSIIPIFNSFAFRNPNDLEALLSVVASNNKIPPYLCCYPDGARLINVPANRVQNTHQNRFEDTEEFSPDTLNELFLSGKRMDYDAFFQTKQNNVHCPLPLVIK